MKTLIIAEKPFQKQDMQDMLEKSEGQFFTEKKGYAESEIYIVACFQGHLLELAEPRFYGEKYGNWDFDAVPVIPEGFFYGYKTEFRDKGKMLAGLAAGCGDIVNACDPDMEGEGIFRRWLEKEGVSNRVLRFWPVSQAYRDMVRAFSEMKESEEYDSLASAQECRAEADWLVGMNATKAYTCAAGQVLHMGRVKTATLSLIAGRDRDIKEFVPHKVCSVTARWQGMDFTFVREKNKVFSPKEAEQIKDMFGGGEYCIGAVKVNNRIVSPPKCYSLPQLQKDANTRYGFSLKKTLSVVQKLYEKKMVTYPRTDSSMLPVSDLPAYQELARRYAGKNRGLLLPDNEIPSTVSGDESNHSALAPTGNDAYMEADENKIFSLINERFAVAFMRPCVFTEAKVFIVCPAMDESGEEGEEAVKQFFFASVCKLVDRGFRSLKEVSEERKKEEEKAAMLFDRLQEIGDGAYPLQKIKVESKDAPVPKYFTPATLITAMMKAGKEGLGIGTAATRHIYPDELEKQGYISVKGNEIKLTGKGKALIRVAPPELKSAELTELWEIALRGISEGTVSPEEFRLKISIFVKDIVENAKNDHEGIKEEVSGADAVFPCPKCKSPVNERKGAFKCSSEPCGWFAPKVYCGRRVSADVYREMIENGRTGILGGFKKDDKSFSAAIKLNSDFSLGFDNSVPGYKCPRCGSGINVFGKKYACSDTETCKWEMFTVRCQKELTGANVKQLLTKGRTNRINGFISKKGNTFSAVLYFDTNKKVQFDFPEKREK